ncbi:hypothetical protein [Pontiella sp.]|uniref:hypothetical protein n=1 Tax=Pontiella sp. TaxID=2837462 RepID=UPI00356B2D4E
MKANKVYMKTSHMRKALAVCAGLVCGLFVASPALGNLMVNPNFNQGADNLDGYEAFAFFQQGAATINSSWALADAPVTADGGGTAVFGMNTQLALADAFWTGASQEMSFQQNFWTPDNNAGVTPTTDLYNQTLTFSGNVLVLEPYAAGNTGVAFIQFLDQSYNSTAFVTADVTTSGAFSFDAVVPASGLNIIQVGFRNSGIEGTAGEIAISDLSVTAIPEPSTMAFVGLFGGALLLIRRRTRN